MKKSSILLSAAMAVFALGSCQDNLGTIELNNGYTVAFSASVDQATKTTLDGYTVNWAEGDVIWAVTTDEAWGKPYADDNNGATIANFTCSGGVFSSELTIAAGSHTFNLLYGGQRSYHRGAGTTVQITNQDEDVAHPTASVAKYDALAGSFTATMPQTAPATVNMNHLFTLMKVNVKNESGAAVAADKFTFTAPSGINVRGVYYIDFSATPVTASYSKNGSNEIIVALSNGTIAAGATVPVYFVMAPCTINGEVSMKITSGEDSYTVTKNVSSKSFEAGKLNTANISISSKDVKDAKSLPYTETLKGTLGDFSIVNKVLPEGLTYVWKSDASYAKASAYKSGRYAAESWLVSPTISLVGATKPLLTFSHIVNFATDQSSVLSVKISQDGGTNWTNLTVPNWPAGIDWTAAQSGDIDLSAYKGKNVKIAFAYTSTESEACTWEVFNFSVAEEEVTPPETKTFSLKAESVEVGSDATSATMTVYGNASFTVNCPSGVTADPSSFPGSESNVYTAVTLSFASNPTTSPKTYTITATTTDIVEGAQTLTFTVNQKASKNIAGDAHKDILDHDAVGVWGTSYTNWGPKAGPSGATYAGQTSGGNKNDVIQLRATKPSGIVVSSATKYVKSVTVTWTSDNTAGRKFDIYGNTGSFTSAEDMYSTVAGMTKVGTIEFDSANLTKTYTFDKNYHNLGMRAASNSIYLTEIQVEWSDTKVGDDPVAELPKLTTPSVTCTAHTETTLTFIWGAVENAVEYSVKFDGGEPFTTNELTYTVEDLEPGSSHTLTVKAIADGVNYNDSSVGSCNAMTDSPAGALTATFDFSSATFLSNQGIELPGSGAGTNIASKTLTVGVISFTSTDGGTETRIWNNSGSYDLRVYKNGGSFTLSAAGKTITKIVLTGGTTNKLSTEPDGYESGTWTGRASSVKFTASDTNKIKTIVVTYE